MTNFIKNFWKDEEGATAIEYALIAGLMAVGLVAAMGFLVGDLDGSKGGITGFFKNIADKLTTSGESLK